MTTPRTEPYDVPGFGLVPMVYVNAWSAYEAFRRLGFTKDEVEFMCCQNGDLGFVRDNVLHVEVRAQGLDFVYTVDQIDRPREEANECLGKFLNHIASLIGQDSPLVMEIYRSTEMGAIDGKHFLTLAAAMVVKGFQLPVVARMTGN